MRLRNQIKSEAWIIAWPGILAAFSQNIIGLTDTAFLGRISQEALGGGGLAILWMYVVCSFAIGFGSSVQVVVARRLGEKQSFMSFQTFVNSTVPALVLSFVQFFVLWVSCFFFLSSFFDSPSVYSSFQDYLSFRMFDVFGLTFYYLFRGYYNGISQNRIIGFASFLLIIINVALNYILAFGWWIFPPLGIRGIAIASVLSQLFVIFIFVLHCFFFHYQLYKWFQLRFDFSFVLYLYKLAFPIGMQNFISIGSFFVFMKITEFLGSDSLAISEMTKNLYLFFMIPTWGYGSASSTIISKLIGAKEFSKVIPSIKIISFENFKIASIPCMLFLLFPSFFYSILTDDSSLVMRAENVGRIVAAALLIYSFAWIWVCAVIGTGASSIAFYIELLALFFYLSYIFLCYSLKTDLLIVWICEIIYMIVMIFLSKIYINSGKWRKIQI